MSNGAVLSPQSNHADNNNDAKKVKTRSFSFHLIYFFLSTSRKTQKQKEKRGEKTFVDGALTSFFPDARPLKKPYS